MGAKGQVWERRGKCGSEGASVGAKGRADHEVTEEVVKRAIFHHKNYDVVDGRLGV